MRQSISVPSTRMNDRPGTLEEPQNPEFARAIRAGFIAEIGESIQPIGMNDLAGLRREYSSLIIHLDRLRSSLIAADVLYRPDNGSWSIKEILGHLIDTDREIWWPRIDAAIAQDHPDFVTQDQKEIVRRNRWQSLEIGEILAQLMRVRWNYSMRMNTMATECFERTGQHLALGQLSVLQILQILVAHDAHYLDNVRELIEETTIVT
jgi:hypothetical protein